MRHYFLNFFIITLFFVMLIFPDAVFSGACKGLLLWFNTVLPTLLPFLIISNILINTSAINLLVHLTSPILCRFFNTTSYGSFAVLCGFLCGYPIGGKITSDLYVTGKISKPEATYLLSFCNNTSPMFIIGYIVHQTFKSDSLTLLTLGILIISPVLCSFIFRKIFLPVKSRIISKNTSHIVNTTASLFDDCIINSFETLTKIGGYIIVFTVFTEVFITAFHTSDTFINLLLSTLEITTGISLINSLQLPFSVKYIAILALTSFGGWCSIAQTYSVLKESRLSIKYYIIEKLVTALVTSLLAFIFIKQY